MKDICLCISSIAAVEIPNKHWPSFISNMASAATSSENRFFKYAGIYNLGLVMEILEPSDFNTDDQGCIWNTILQNMVAQEDTKLL